MACFGLARLGKAYPLVILNFSSVTAAREMFTKYGYANTSPEEIVRLAGVTRGALYHQFQDKNDLFKAVFKEVGTALVQKIATRMLTAEGTTWDRIVHTGIPTLIETLAEPTPQSILYIDGPAVLKRNVITLDSDPGLLFIRQGFALLMADGFIEEQPVDPLAHVFAAAFFEAGVYIARADDTEEAQREMLACLTRLANGLRASPPSAAGRGKSRSA